jgi:hypothetical protein
MASQINLFKIIGDSNTRNAFSTRLKLCERITGQTTEFVSASAYSSGLTALANLNNPTVVYVSFLTNGLVDATELCSDLSEIDGVIQDKIREYIAALRMATSINSSTKFVMMPPMTRITPFWLEAKLPQISAYITAQSQGIENLTLLPPLVVTKENLEADGVHLNRESQSRLFSYIMEALFPDKMSTKTKNASRDRANSDVDMGTPPAKKSTGESLSVTPGSASSPSQPYTATPLPSQVIFDALESADLVASNPHPEDLVVAPSSPPATPDESAVISNPDLQQLYQMLSKKIDMVSGSSTAVQTKVDAVQKQMSTTTLKVEYNTQVLRSLHIRTASQAETLDAHSNTLNLNFVMISGIPDDLISAPEGELPGIKLVVDKLIKYTPLLVSGVKFAVYAKYIKHQVGKLPNIKACFINSDTALAFRDAANKLRVAKKDFWSSVYVSNDPTKSTRVRISILQSLSKRLASLPANNGKTIFVSRFDVKPQLCFKFGGRVEKRLDFVAAIEKYRSVLCQEDKEAAKKVAGKTFSEDELRQFLVL